MSGHFNPFIDNKCSDSLSVDFKLVSLASPDMTNIKIRTRVFIDLYYMYQIVCVRMYLYVPPNSPPILKGFGCTLNLSALTKRWTSAWFILGGSENLTKLVCYLKKRWPIRSESKTTRFNPSVTFALETKKINLNLTLFLALGIVRFLRYSEPHCWQHRDHKSSCLKAFLRIIMLF